MRKRTSDEWLHDLQATGPVQRQALDDLREYLFRAVLVYLRQQRSDLDEFATSEIRAMAQDFAQEATLSVHATLDSFRGDAKFTTWAYRFVINEAISELRRRYYRDKLSLEKLSAEETDIFMSLAEAEASDDPGVTAERRDIARLLLQIIRSELNERQRIAVLGVYFQDRPMQEIAEQLDTSPNTVYKMLYDSRQKIKGKLHQLRLSGGDILAPFAD